MNWVRFVVPALILFIVIATAMQLNNQIAEKPQNKSALPEKTTTIGKNHSLKKMHPQKQH